MITILPNDCIWILLKAYTHTIKKERETTHNNKKTKEEPPIV